MNNARLLVASVAAALFLWSPANAQGDSETPRYRAAFERVIEGLNDNSFETFNRAIDKDDMIARIVANRPVAPDVRRAFASDFWAALQQEFVASFPASDGDILGTTIDFEMEGQRGRAVVRYAASGYRYSYHVYELQPGPNGRLAIVDWVDYYSGSRFTDDVGISLVMAMPGREATRQILQDKTLDDGEIFQVNELFKAVRDKKAERFFQIADGMSDSILNDPLVSRLGWRMARMTRDKNRIEDAVRRLSETRPDDALTSLRLLEYYIPRRQYQDAIDALTRLQAATGIEDGASESLKASAALANGDVAEALELARKATQAEPGLELVWWTLLRTGTRAEDYDGVTEALTRLEDDFGHTLGPATLRRDPFLKVLADRQEYRDWREARE